VLLNTPPTATSEQAVSHQQQHQQQHPTRHRFTQLLPVTVTLLLLLLPPSPFHKQQLPTSPNKMHSQLHAPDATPQNGCLFYGTHY
jgi:hypothetical protein